MSSEITGTLNNLCDSFKTAKVKYNMYLAEKKRLEEELSENRAQVDIYNKVKILLQETGDYARHQAKTKIENIVNQGLQVVFGGNPKFTIETTVKNNLPAIEFYLEEEGTKIQLEKPDYSKGGGKIDVISLSLRLALIELEKIPGPVLLDEIGKHVSLEYSSNVAYFLKEYSEAFNKQIILVTHNKNLAEIGDIKYRISFEKGSSKIEELS